MFDPTLEDFRDGTLEGSHHEHRIFQDVFFGRNTGSTSKKSLVTEMINFECENSKTADTSPCSNSNNSALTSQSSSKTLLLDDSDMNENYGGTTASGCFAQRYSLAKRDDQDKTVKRIKFSVAEPSKTEPGAIEVLTSSMSPNDMMHKPDTGNNANDLVVHRALWNSDENAGKEMVVSKVVTSPVPQESYPNGLLLASHPAMVMEKSEPLYAEKIAKESDSLGLDITNLKMDSKKDLRSFLRQHIISLFSAAGWLIEKRRRPSKNYMESVYRSPGGRPFREFPKAWRACGQILYANRCNLMPNDNGKEWTDISQFWADLTYGIMNIEKEMDQSDLSNALALQWSLLDPFVIAVFIDRKVDSLIKGDTVKVARSILINKIDKRDAVVALRKKDCEGFQSSQSKMLAWHSNSSQVAKSGSAIFDEIYHACNEQYGDESFLQFGASTNGVAEYQISAFTDTADKAVMFVEGLSNEMEVQFHGMCKDIITSSDMTSVPVSGLDDTCFQSCGCRFNLPVAAQNINMHGRLESVSPHENSNLIDVENGEDHEPTSMFVISGVPQQSEICKDEGEGGECIQSSGFEMRDKVITASKKRIRRKSKKISEIKSITSYDRNEIDAHADSLDFKEAGEDFVPTKTNKSSKKSLPLGGFLNMVEKKGSKIKKVRRYINGPKNGEKKSTTCKIKDDDLLVSAIIKNKDFSPAASRSTSKKKARKPRSMKRKSQKGSCKLLPRNFAKMGKQYVDNKWSTVGAKTVLSWLIDVGAVGLNDVIQYRNPKKEEDVIKDGLITRDGIMCKCCSMVFSVSEFKSHAGFNMSRPCLNLFMESGKPFTLCQLQAWSTEYKTRKSRSQVVQTEDEDQNDDSCGICGEGGELICCDNCPSTYHQACLSTEELPEGSWYCANCICWICGELVNDRDASSSLEAHKCSQCEHKYHDACQKGKLLNEGTVSDHWFCGGNCQEVYLGLHSHLGICTHIADGFCWTLLRCIHEDQSFHSAQRLALKAECNSKLAVALTIMEECFQSMVDPRTGIDMIPQVLYNWGSEFARLNFHGFYTALLEKDDILVSVASIRVHGTTVAEMPLIATCSNYRRQGMCKRLLAAIEEMLISFKVEKLVISAIPEVVETWTKGFGFIPVSSDEKLSLKNINFMVFPGTVLLKKPLYEKEEEDMPPGPLTEEAGNQPVTEHFSEFAQQLEGNCYPGELGINVDSKLVESHNLQESEVGIGIGNINGVGEPELASTLAQKESSNIEGNSLDANPSVEATEPSEGNFFPGQTACKPETLGLTGGGGSQDINLQGKLSKLRGGESVSAVEMGQHDMPCNVQSVNSEGCLGRWAQLVCEFNEK